MVKYLPFLLIFFGISACKSDYNKTASGNKKHVSFLIQGHLSGGSNKKLLFQEIQINSFTTKDTISLDNKGSFTFEHKVNFPVFYALKNEAGDYIILLPDKNQLITIKGDYYFNEYSLSGSPDSELIAKLHIKTRKFLDAVNEISAITRDSVDSPGYTGIKMKLQEKYNDLYSELRQYSIDFIEQNPASPAIILALNNKTGPDTYVFNPVNDLDIFIRADSILYYLYPEFPHVKSLHDKINLIKIQLSVKSLKDQNTDTNIKNLPVP